MNTTSGVSVKGLNIEFDERGKGDSIKLVEMNETNIQENPMSSPIPVEPHEIVVKDGKTYYIYSNNTVYCVQKESGKVQLTSVSEKEAKQIREINSKEQEEQTSR